MKEHTIWNGTPSHWSNFKAFSLGIIFTLVTLVLTINQERKELMLLSLIPVIWMLWKYLLIRTWRIQITDKRIIESKGVFSTTTDELELYRVKDIRLSQPFWLRLVGLSNIELITSDKSDAYLIVPAIRNGKSIREELRTAVEQRRSRKGVKEVDFE